MQFVLISDCRPNSLVVSATMKNINNNKHQTGYEHGFIKTKRRLQDIETQSKKI